MNLSKKIIGLLLAGSLLLGACDTEADEETVAPEEQAEIHVELIAKGFQHQFWNAVYQGAQDAAEDLDVTINFTGPANETAIQEQSQMLSNAVNQNPSAIALASLDTESQIDLITQAQNAGIPIIGFDSGVPGAPEGSIVANASTDNVAAAALGADHVFEAVEDQVAEASVDNPVRFGVVSQEVNSMSIRSRTEGFIDRVEELSLQLENINDGEVAIVGHDRFSNGVSENEAAVIIELQVPTQASDAAIQTSAQTLFNKADLIAIFGTNELGANGLINGNDATGGRLGDDVVGAGIDSGALQIQAVRSGDFVGSITQDPIQIGYKAVELAVQAVNGEEVEDVDTGAVWYNSDNIDDEEIEQLLYE